MKNKITNKVEDGIVDILEANIEIFDHPIMGNALVNSIQNGDDFDQIIKAMADNGLFEEVDIYSQIDLMDADFNYILNALCFKLGIL